MANEVLVKTGTQISFADHAGDFAPAAANVIEVGTPTNVDLTLTGLTDGAAVNSDKFNFGATRARQYSIDAVLEFAATPTAGDVVELYLVPSHNPTAGSGNPGRADGVDGAYTGDGGGTLDESVRQMIHIGQFVCTDLTTTTPQIAHCGVFEPPAQYGQLIVKNESGAAFHSDDVEMNIVLTPIVDEIQ